VKTVHATGRKTLIMAGVWTCVCVAGGSEDGGLR
jgi:hypothetical protein